MSLIQTNESFLLSQFREFYTEVIRLKLLIADSDIPVAEEPVSEANGNGNGHIVEGGVTAKLPVIDSALLQTWSGSEKITSLAVRGTVNADREPSPEQSKLALLVWQNLT